MDSVAILEVASSPTRSLLKNILPGGPILMRFPYCFFRGHYPGRNIINYRDLDVPEEGDF